MNLTSNFDYCAELGIAQVKEIFHLAFKSEDRYPHNIGPLPRNYSGQDMSISVTVLDDNDRPADLSFKDDRHILFSFPFDLTAEIPDAPDPNLSRVTLRVQVNIPALLTHWQEDSEEVLGLDFAGVTPDDVEIVTLEGLPTITADNFLAAIHSRYDHIQHVYTDPGSGSSLVLYDGNRDPSLDPPNAATPFEIQVSLETHSGQEYLKVTAPIHVSVPIPGGSTTYDSYGRLIFWRPVTRTDYYIQVDMSSEPGDASLATQVELDNTSGTTAELNGILNQIHAAYSAGNGDPTTSHLYTLSGNTLVVYDDNLDTSLIPPKCPPNAATPSDIQAVFDTGSGTEYLKFTFPINANVPSAVFNSYGRILAWRLVTRDHTAHTLSADMSAEPAASTGLQTQVEFDTTHPAKGVIASMLAPLAASTLSAYDTPTGPSFEAVTAGLNLKAIDAINSFGPVREPAFSDAGARQVLKEEISAYIKVRRYPVYSPKSGDASITLSTPAGFLLVDAGVLAILMNRRHGSEADDYAPDNFLGSNPLALAVGLEKVYDMITEAVKKSFPGLDGANGSYSGSADVNADGHSATVTSMTVTPSDAGEHDQSEGHMWISGKAVVHIDCWPDPTVGFDGPVFMTLTRFDDADGCGFNVSAVAGKFDVDESCCDVFIDLIIPIVGWIMLAVIESTINSVGGDLAAQYADEQGRQVQAMPPVVNGIAKVTSCLISLTITSQGLIMPGVVEIRRLGTSFDDLKDKGDQPKP